MPPHRRSIVIVVLLFVVSALSGCIIEIGQDARRDPPPFDPDRWPPIEEALIRPGTQLFGPPERSGFTIERHQCTTGFVFSSTTDDSLYVSTGSHCMEGAKIGDRIELAGGQADGIVVYCSWGTLRGRDYCPGGAPGQEPEGNDFALIRVIDAQRGWVHPAVLHIGGPVGMGGTVARDAPVATTVNSESRDRAEVRSGRVWEAGDDTHLVYLDRPLVRGDSGSPVLGSDGRALGIMSFSAVVDDCPGDEPHVHGVAVLDHAVRYMEANTELRIELEIWPHLELPDPPPRQQDLC